MRWLARMLVACLGVTAALMPARARAQESMTVAAERVSVRTTPANDGKLVMTLVRGTGVTVVERRQGWARVSARSKNGWVRTNSLAPVASRKSSPSSPSAAAAGRNEPARAHAAERRPPQVGALSRGDNVLGPVVGLGGINGSLALGGELEHALARLPSLGNGTLGLSVQAFYYHYAPFPGMGITSIPVGASANYHFGLKDRRIDPFLGLGVGYTKVSISGSGYTVTGGSSSFLWGRAGVRYFVKPGLALHADAGLGTATLNVGVMVRP